MSSQDAFVDEIMDLIIEGNWGGFFDALHVNSDGTLFPSGILEVRCYQII